MVWISWGLNVVRGGSSVLLFGYKLWVYLWSENKTSIFIYLASRDWQNIITAPKKTKNSVLFWNYHAGAHDTFLSVGETSVQILAFHLTLYMQKIQIKKLPKCGWKPTERYKTLHTYFFSFDHIKTTQANVQNPRHGKLWSRITLYKHIWSQNCGLCAEMGSWEMHLN